LLIFWILGLAYVALGSLNGDISKLLLSMRLAPPIARFDDVSFSFPTRPSSDQKRRCPLPREVLSRLYSYQEYPPPVDALLNVIAPGWAEVKATNDGQCTEDEAKRAFDTYADLSNRIWSRMRSLAGDETADPKLLLDVAILPPNFPKATATETLRVPPEVSNWIAQERVTISQELKKYALIETFLRLSVLGAFGALIFLIRDYTSADEEKKLSHYIFRPVLGIFLAMAVFVVDILAHSLISTASIFEIRDEPLYILALGAGLLSERAYDAVRRRADSALERYAKIPSEAEPNQRTEADANRTPTPGA
jgi:hypothetical protein